ncbi:MAG: glycosyltransferase family 4 protein [Gemmatimonadales bacterium]|nr:MAG: glycosyltransferase family 4 protein [Gemmatimonadales bacterium]
MRILILAPPRVRADTLTGLSFIDEEILALSEAGIEPFVLVPPLEQDETVKGVRLLGVPRARIWDQRRRAASLVAGQRSRIPGACLRHPLEAIHRARYEAVMVQRIREHGIELVQSHFGPFLGFGGMLASHATGRPLVASFRGMDLLVEESAAYGLQREAFYRASLGALIRAADCTTYVSEFMRDKGLEAGADPERAFTVRKGVDLETFAVAPDRRALRTSLGIEGPMILVVAALIRRKGVDTVVRALARLESGAEATLVICGTGPEKAALETLARELGVSDRVQFRGQVTRAEIPRYFAACDVFVLASVVEASGNVLVEAMSSGRPVLCTDSGGPPQYVQDGVTGVVVPPGDDAAMARGLDRLLEDAELADGMGAAGRRLAEEVFGYDRMIGEILDVYRKAAGS